MKGMLEQLKKKIGCLIIQNYVNHFLYGSVMSIIKPKHCNWWGSIVSCSVTTGLVASKPLSCCVINNLL